MWICAWFPCLSAKWYLLYIKLIVKAILIVTFYFRPRDNGPEGMEPDGVIEVGTNKRHVIKIFVNVFGITLTSWQSDWLSRKKLNTQFVCEHT